MCVVVSTVDKLFGSATVVSQCCALAVLISRQTLSQIPPRLCLDSAQLPTSIIGDGICWPQKNRRQEGRPLPPPVLRSTVFALCL